MGGIQFPHLSNTSPKTWQWCEARDLYVFTSGDNYIADAESRRVHADVEWELANSAYQTICDIFRKIPEIDLFASRINDKCPKFVSWHRDPDAYRIDAFTLPWLSYYFYAFPPFLFKLRVLQKKYS